jgi:hypothetical protein
MQPSHEKLFRKYLCVRSLTDLQYNGGYECRLCCQFSILEGVDNLVININLAGKV